MGHSIVALVTKQKPLEEKLILLEIPEIIENGFNVIPLDTCHATYWGKKWNVYSENSEHFGGTGIICIETIQHIAHEIGITDYALIGTDYFGGIGTQAARVYKNAKEIIVENAKQYDDYCLKGIDINSALKEIGVVRKGNYDEFDTLNLSNHRSFEKYFEKYEKYCEE